VPRLELNRRGEPGDVGISTLWPGGALEGGTTTATAYFFCPPAAALAETQTAVVAFGRSARV
jgi:hypothetical protein